jgi:ferredoxin
MFSGPTDMKITYLDDDLVASVHTPEATILEVSLANKLPHFRECGGRGRCAMCRVHIVGDFSTFRSGQTARPASPRNGIGIRLRVLPARLA